MSEQEADFPDDPRPRCGSMWIVSQGSMRVHDSTQFPKTVMRHYQCNSMPEAITAWGGLKNDSETIQTASAIINDIEKAAGSRVFEMYFLDSRSYLTFVFDDNLERGMAYLNVGFIDHRVDLEGSVPTSEKGVWRTHLPTAKLTSSSRRQTSRIETVLCGQGCGIRVSVYGECSCGWNPRKLDSDYF
jgi:hypothetical protein